MFDNKYINYKITRQNLRDFITINLLIIGLEDIVKYRKSVHYYFAIFTNSLKVKESKIAI